MNKKNQYVKLNHLLIDIIKKQLYTPPMSGKKSNRYDYAKAVWGEKLFEWSRQDEIGQAMGNSINSVFKTIASYDPSKNNKKAHQYLFWLCRFVMKGVPETLEINGESQTILNPIKPEDIDKIRENIETFIYIQPLLAKEKRDISTLSSAQELQEFVDPYKGVEVKSLNQLKKEEREAILQETTFLYEGELGKILIPTTKRAAIFWGQATQWCFAATRSKNYFDAYTDSTLVIYISNDVAYLTKKTAQGNDIKIPYQVKFAGHKRSLLKDVNDQSTVTQLPQSFRDLILQSGQLDFCMEYGSINPDHFPPKTFSEDALFLYICTVKKQGFQNIRMHKEDLTERLYKEILTIKDNYLCNHLKQVPIEMRTEDVCNTAIQLNCWDLESIPLDLRTEGIYSLALQRNPLLLEKIPIEDRTKPLCITALSAAKNIKDFCTVKLSVPEEHIDEDIYILMLQNHKFSFKYVPRKFQTSTVYGIAVKYTNLNINKVPPHLRTDQMYEDFKKKSKRLKSDPLKKTFPSISKVILLPFPSIQT